MQLREQLAAATHERSHDPSVGPGLEPLFDRPIPPPRRNLDSRRIDDSNVDPFRPVGRARTDTPLRVIGDPDEHGRCPDGFTPWCRPRGGRRSLWRRCLYASWEPELSGQADFSAHAEAFDWRQTSRSRVSYFPRSGPLSAVAPKSCRVVEAGEGASVELVTAEAGVILRLGLPRRRARIGLRGRESCRRIIGVNLACHCHGGQNRQGRRA